METSYTFSWLFACVILLPDFVFQGGRCDSSLELEKKFISQQSPQSGSSFVFPVFGNVHTLGYYSVSLSIGKPPRVYELDIDTGSDITWLQCDAPCKGCTKPSDQLYKPKNNLVGCADPLCLAIQPQGISRCENPNDQCDYFLEYADQGSSLGVLVSDLFHFQLKNGSNLSSRLTFGCGYDQQYRGLYPPPATSGVLGLGNGKTSINFQLHSEGIIKNVFGHCFSSRGGGYLLMGSSLLPEKVKWVPLAASDLDKHYVLGPAELLFGGRRTGLKQLYLTFDSGSSYSYFNSQVYQTTVDLIQNNLNGKHLKRAQDDATLPICWKGKAPFKSLSEVNSYFKPMTLSFKGARNVELQLPPENYLIISKHGNVCLGILNGSEIGLKNLNIVGDIFMQDKIVAYDLEKKRMGWSSADCSSIPKSPTD